MNVYLQIFELIIFKFILPLFSTIDCGLKIQAKEKSNIQEKAYFISNHILWVKILAKEKSKIKEKAKLQAKAKLQ